MNPRSMAAAASTVLLSLLIGSSSAQAAEMKVLSAIAIQPVIEELGPGFERATGHKLAVTFATLGAIVKRVREGESADVVVIPQSGIDSLLREGRVAADSVTVLASASMGMAVRKGAPKPDISSPEAFKRSLLAAKSVTYPNPAMGGASGAYFLTVLDRLGIADEMKPKTVLLTTPGQSPQLVARGEVELAIGHIQDLVAVPGVELVGPFPKDLQQVTALSAAMLVGAGNPDVARQLIRFLRAPEAAAVIRAKGMEPPAP